MIHPATVIPAKAGIQFLLVGLATAVARWASAFAGVTNS